MAYVYILLSEKDHRTYTGSTSDLHRRFQEHQLGKVKATSHRRPLKLIYSETFQLIDEARRRERYFKTGAGRRFLKKLFSTIGV